jgi:uncharacterized protein (UPF0332 family)
MSRDVEERVRQHLGLSKGLLETTVLKPESTGFEERNALSRAYYAMFHASSAWLLLKHGVEVGKLRHAEFHAEMHRRRGKEFGDFFRDMYGLRRAADYRQDWSPARMVTEDRLRKARTHIVVLCQETEVGLSER